MVALLEKSIDRTETGGKLDERAMLADLSIGFWEGRKKDKKTTTEVEDRKGAGKDAGGWWTRIIPPDSLRKISSAVIEGRRLHWKYTLPWMDSGPRILPAEAFFDYTEALRKVEAEFKAAVREFLDQYPRLVAEAPQRLGDLYVEKYYPTAEQLERKFHWRIDFMPIPNKDDFRVSIGDDAADEIRKSIETQTSAAVEQAMGDLWQRLHCAVSKVAERLSDPENIFRDSLIGNMVELTDLLPKLNVTGNRDLEQMRQQVIKKLAGLKPQELRDNKSARADAAKQAQDILNKMSGFMAPSGGNG